MQIETLIPVALIASILAGGTLILRAIYKYQEWKDGDENAFWNFLSLILGGAAGIFFFLGFIGAYGSYALFELGITLGTFLALGALVFTFLSVLFLWKKS